MKKLTVEFNNLMLYDRLFTLSDEYSISTDLLINLAIKRLIDDVEFIRNLRVGKVKLE